MHEIIYLKKKKDTFSPSSLLINGQTVTDKFSIAENFHNFLYQLEKKLLEEITPINLDTLTQIPSSLHLLHLKE